MQRNNMEKISIEYWNELANQLIVISSLLSGFTIAVIANLLVSETNTRLSRIIMVAAVLAASFFLITLFTNTRVLLMTTNGYPFKITEQRLINYSSIGSISFYLGMMSLIAIVALAGWTKSKKTGIFTTIVGVLTFLFIFLILMLN